MSLQTIYVPTEYPNQPGWTFAVFPLLGGESLIAGNLVEDADCDGLYVATLNPSPEPDLLGLYRLNIYDADGNFVGTGVFNMPTTNVCTVQPSENLARLDFTGTDSMLKSESTNMRGTDGAITSLAGIATAADVSAAATSLAAYGDAHWLTATGFATTTDVSDAQTAIQSDIAGLHDFDPNNDTVAYVTLVGSVAGAVGSVTGNVGGNVTGSIGSLATQAKADVKAEADTALADYGALKPTIAGRTLDVTSTGAAGIDWSNVENPTTTVGLAGTTISTAQEVDLVDAPNATAIAAIQSGLSTFDASSDGVILADSEDVYHADVTMDVDAANSRNEYLVTWFKNGVPLTSGITSPTIKVVKFSDGTDFISQTSMTQIGSTGSYKYTTGTVITAGEPVSVVVAASIDNSTRTWVRNISMDSSS